MAKKCWICLTRWEAGAITGGSKGLGKVIATAEAEAMRMWPRRAARSKKSRGRQRNHFDDGT